VAYGWKDVFAVPIHGPGSMQGLVTMATRETLAFDATDCAVLEMMARAVWERCRTSEGFGMFAPERVHLSPREIECLQWAAVGKSDADIAVLVGIKPATAHFHIERAKKRLGVKTRVEAVAVGVLHGVI
jgi:DNA-binding CsgD family transcriptional regulator